MITILKYFVSYLQSDLLIVENNVDVVLPLALLSGKTLAVIIIITTSF